MTIRTALSARRWVLCAVTGLFLFHPAALMAQEDDPQEELKSAVQRKLEALYAKEGKQAPNMMPAGRTAPVAEPSIRQTAQQTAPRQQAAAPARRTSTTTGPKSEVQRQLEELYAREGREMPQMNLPQAVESVQSDAEAESEPAEVVAEEEKKPSFMQRLNPFKRKPAPKQQAKARRPVRPEQETEVDAAQADEPKKGSRFVPGFLKRREAEAPREMPQPRTAEAITSHPRRSAQAPAEMEPQQKSRVPRGTRMTAPESDIADSDTEEMLEEAEEAAEDAAVAQEEKIAAPSGRAKATANLGRAEVPRAPKLVDEPELVRKPAVEKSLDLDEEKDEMTRIEPATKKSAKELLDLEPERAPAKKAEVARDESKKDEEEVSAVPYVEDFEDPFTEMSETVADSRGADPKVAPIKHVDKKQEAAEKVEKESESPIGESPFTGLTLDEPGDVRGSKNAKPAAAPKTEPAKSIDAPKSVESPKLVETPKPSAPKLELEPETAPELKKQPETAPVATAPQLSAPTPKLEKVPDVAPNPLPAANAAAMPDVEDPLERAKLRRLRTRRGQTGLKGFCPVALREQRDLVDSRAEFSTVFEGRTYQFSSAEAKQAFESDPEKYVPARGGMDVTIEANSHQSVEGSLDHAVWFRDRLYLFSTAESLEAFVQNPTDYVK